MMRISSSGTARWCALVLLVTPAACSSDAKIQEIQRAADEKLKKAEDEAQTKLTAAQKEIETLKAQFADASAKAKADAEEALQKEKATAEEQAKLAEETLVRARQAFKAEARAKLADANEDLKDVQARAQRATAKTKATATKSLQDIAKLETEINKDIAAFDSATLDTFNATKAKVDKGIAKLKGDLAAARAKLK
jgi:hypothetical protein